ncbi:MAG: peptidylprolyl isomerase [Deltaproteobacteria bacterium]|nr:peptidylprolyl isomerase [Deltaproteobacteria bacterium]
MLRVISAALFFAVMVYVMQGSGFAGETNKKTENKTVDYTKVKAVIETKFGNIEMAFFPEKAPGHVKNFVDLAEKGFYDGTLFHRVIPGFMIQGGDPNTKGTNSMTYGSGGPGYTIKAEFNDISHTRGILSMARANDPNSAGSQFFIVVSDSKFLDKNYTVFGKVIKGMEVADKIVSASRDGRDLPHERIEMKVKIVPNDGKFE